MSQGTNQIQFCILHGGAGDIDDKMFARISPWLEKAGNVALNPSNRSVPISLTQNIPLTVMAVYCGLYVLEECPHLNSGCGSNLTFEKKIEQDGTIIHCSTNIPNVPNVVCIGSCPGISHPSDILLNMYADKYCAAPDENLVKPIILVGNGVILWTKLHNVLVTPITPSRERLFTWNQISQIVDSAKQSEPKSNASESLESIPNISNDTVGIMVIDSEGNIACGSVSGGVWFKKSGRLGQSAVPFAGNYCIAPPSTSSSYDGPNETLEPGQKQELSQHTNQKDYQNNIGAGCITTGVGEFLIQHNVAHTLVQQTLNYHHMYTPLIRQKQDESTQDLSLEDCSKDYSHRDAKLVFPDCVSPIIQNLHSYGKNTKATFSMFGGVILQYTTSFVEVLVFHNSPSLPFAYSSRSSKRTKKMKPILSINNKRLKRQGNDELIEFVAFGVSLQ